MIDIEDGRHPVVEKLITGERYVPNSIRLDSVDHQQLLITGPNMAGKSTVLRQVALIALMDKCKAATSNIRGPVMKRRDL